MTRPTRQRGFTLLELVVVFSIIALVGAVGTRYFIDAMTRAEAAALESLASRFAYSAATVRAWSRMPASIDTGSHGVDERGVPWVAAEGATVYVNEYGWPATASAASSPAIGGQTDAECRGLLEALFRSPRRVGGIPAQEREYTARALNGRVCRYRPASRPDGDWYFDYFLETGRVDLSLPVPEIGQKSFAPADN